MFQSEAVQSQFTLQIFPFRLLTFKVETFNVQTITQCPRSLGTINSSIQEIFIHFIYALNRAAMHVHVSSLKEDPKEYHPQVYKEPKVT